jgi:hypothetical protein
MLESQLTIPMPLPDSKSAASDNQTTPPTTRQFDCGAFNAQTHIYNMIMNNPLNGGFDFLSNQMGQPE